MNNFMDFLKKKSEVDKSYLDRKQKEEEVWQGFSEEVRILEEKIGYEFRRVLLEIGPVPVDEHVKSYMPQAKSPEVLGWSVEYHPLFKGHVYRPRFSIEITRAMLRNGEIIDNNVPSSYDCCPHGSLDYVCGWDSEIHPKIMEFKEKFGVDFIAYPHNHCEHE